MNISRLRAAKPPPDRIPMIENAIILTTNPLKFNTMPDGSFCVAFCPRNLKGELVIPSTVEFQGKTYTITAIREQSFRDCTELTSITIPETITHIGNYAFHGCTSLKKINLPPMLTKISDWMFSCCKSLTEISLHSGIIEISEGAFSECTKLSSIKIPETVTRIEDKCFYLCDSLESITVDEYNTHYRTLNGVLFNYKTTLLHSYPTAKKDSVYTIPESITEIASWAFRGCEYISKVIFPAKLQKIREQAFENCLSLKDVYFQCDEPPSVGLQAFYNCPINLKIFYPEGNEDLWGTLWHGYKALTWNPDLPQGTPTRRGPLEQILKIFK